jgi:hypothetical protein
MLFNIYDSSQLVEMFFWGDLKRAAVANPAGSATARVRLCPSVTGTHGGCASSDACGTRQTTAQPVTS